MVESSVLPQPKTDIDPKIKRSKEYLLEWARYLNANFKRNTEAGSFWWGSGDIQGMRDNRLYGAGRQNKDQYMKAMGVGKFTKGGNEPTRANPGRRDESANFLNINWDEISVLPKFKAVVVNKFRKKEFDADFTDLSKDVYDKKLKEKYTLLLKGIDPELTEVVGQAQGIDPNLPDTNQFLPKDHQELELWEQMGGLKTAAEIVNKRMSIANFQNSNWKDEIEEKLYSDYFDNKIMACRDYVDARTGEVRVAYVDPLYAACAYNRHTGGRKSPYAFEYRYFTIAELRELTDYPEDLLLEFAQMNKSEEGNQVYFNNNENNMADGALGFESRWYDSVRVRILDFEILTVDKENWTFRKTKDGDTKIYREKYGKEYKNSTSRTTQINSTQNVYKGKWIVGSNEMFDYGLETTMPRESDAEARLSFHFHVGEGLSMVDRLKGNVDMMIHLALKMQNAIAKARPSGLAIEIGSLSKINLGGDDVHPFELLRLVDQSGNLLYRSQTHFGAGGRMNGSGYPFKELEGGLGKDFASYLQSWEFYLNKMREETGLNDVTDGSSPNPEVTKGQAMLAAEATNNALEDFIYAYKKVKKSAALNMALRTNAIVMASKKSYKRYLQMVGENAMDLVEMTKDHTIVELGISIRMKSSEAQIAKFDTIAREAMAAGAIDLIDYQMLMPYVEDGRIEEATALLAYRQSQKQQAEAANQQAAIQQQGESQRMIKQDEMQAKQLESQLRIQEAQALAQIEVQKHEQMAQIDSRFDRGLQTQKGDQAIEQIEETNRGKLQLEAMKETAPQRD